VLHLLYARFWHKVLFDLGVVGTPEPFYRLINQGLVQGEDGQKMSKSRGNVINPDSVVTDFGSDSLRLFELFMGPFDQPKPWSMKGVEGVHRFLARVWRLVMTEDQEGRWTLSDDLAEVEMTSAQRRVAHASVKKVTEDVGAFSFNTAISQMMIFTNEFVGASPRPLEAMRILLRVLSPFAPHLADELWARLGGEFTGFDGLASTAEWPTWREEFLVEDEIEIVVQVNGKLRDKLTVKKDASREELEATARANAKVVESVGAQSIVKVIVVPGKLVNVVAK
jgi:leucyl-tRNA synthetase